MPLEPKDAAYLLDILNASERIRRYMREKTFQQFREDDLLRDAVERNIEIIGEAARRLSESFKREHPEIPWRKMIAQRNVLAHEYEDVRDDEIWDVATVHVPILMISIAPLVPPLPPDIGD